jgi:hypothetical protein
MAALPEPKAERKAMMVRATGCGQIWRFTVLFKFSGLGRFENLRSKFIEFSEQDL